MNLSKKTVILVVLSLLLVALPLSSAFAHGSHVNVQQATTLQQVNPNPTYYQYDPDYQSNYNLNYGNNGYGMGYMGTGWCW